MGGMAVDQRSVARVGPSASKLTEMIRNAARDKKDSPTAEEIRQLFDLRRLSEVWSWFRDRQSTAELRDALRLKDKRLGTVERALALYRSQASSTNEQQRLGAIKGLVEAIGRLVDLEVTRMHQVGVPRLYLLYANPPLDCQRGELPLFYTRGDTAAQELHHIVNAVESLSSEYAHKVIYILAVSPADNDETVATLVRLAREASYKFVVLSSRDVARVLLSPRPHAELATVASRHLDLLDVQPYRTHGTITDNMFFGRKREIDRMLTDTQRCFAIYGGRQLGKTSLMRRIQELLERDPRQRTAFVTCEGIDDGLTLGHEILKEFGLSVVDVKTVPDFEAAFRDYLRGQRKNHTVFVDEVDDLVDIDRTSPHKIFVALRNIHNDQGAKCRFFFAGFKKLYSEFNREYAPFTNFAEPHPLGALSKRDALKLIEEPLCQRLGIELRGRARLLDSIYKFTGGHPCYIQKFCKCLIERVAAEDRLYIFPPDLEHVYGSDDYRSLVLRNHSDNFRDGKHDDTGDVVPKLIVIFAVLEELDRFSQNELLDALHREGIELESLQLRLELKKLMVTSVLQRHMQRYTFTNSAYPRMLRESENLIDIFCDLKVRHEQLARRAHWQWQQALRAPSVGRTGSVMMLRERALEQVVTDSSRNYAIVGGAGVGKSAFLRKLYDIYVDVVNAKPAHIAVSATHKEGGAADVLESCVDWFGKRGGGEAQSAKALRDFVAAESKNWQRIVLLIDDVDSVVARDPAGLHRLLKLFRAVNEEFADGFRVVMTGGWRLYSLVTDPAYAGTIDCIKLERLDERDARLLLSHFLERNSLLLNDETLLDLILEHTAGNARLMSALVARLSTNHQGQGLIDEDRVRAVLDDAGYQQEMLATYQAGCGKRELAVIDAVVAVGWARFTAAEVADLVEEPQAAVDEVLSNLVLLGFLKRLGSRYSFANAHYCEYHRWRTANE